MIFYKLKLKQTIFGQPCQIYNASNLLISVLNSIEAELIRVYWNNNQKEMASPFCNTGNKYKNNTFEVVAYSWNDDIEQTYNFKWKNIKISWYKYCGRDTSVNKKMTNDEINQMLEECLESIKKEDKNVS